MKRFASRAWQGWMVVLIKLGNLQARLFFSFFYLLILAPAAIGLRLLGDPLHLKRRKTSYWLERPAGDTDLEAARRQS